MASCETKDNVFPPRIGSFVTVRHNDPIVEEPHSCPGVVTAICHSKPDLMDRFRKLTGKKPTQAYDITVKTENLGLIRLKRVTGRNYTLVLEPV